MGVFHALHLLYLSAYSNSYLTFLGGSGLPSVFFPRVSCFTSILGSFSRLPWFCYSPLDFLHVPFVLFLFSYSFCMFLLLYLFCVGFPLVFRSSFISHNCATIVPAFSLGVYRCSFIFLHFLYVFPLFSLFFSRFSGGFH